MLDADSEFIEKLFELHCLIAEGVEQNEHLLDILPLLFVQNTSLLYFLDIEVFVVFVASIIDEK